MADPIEIIQTVLTVSKLIYDVVKSIQGAPDELKSLEHAANQIQPILEHLVAMLEKQAGEGAGGSAELSRGLCDEARGFVEAAYVFLDKVAVKSADGCYRVRKAQWIWKASTCKELEGRFRKLCVSVAAFFSCNTHRGLDEFREDFDKGLQMIEDVISTHGAALQEVQMDVRESRNDISILVRELQGHFSRQDEHSQQMLALLYIIVRLTMGTAAESQRRELNHDFDQITLGSSNIAQPWRSYPAAGTHLINSGHDPRLSRHNNIPCNGCSPDCRCCCHQPSLSLVPRQLRSLAGSLSVHHDWLSALLSARTPCNERGCRRHRSNLLKIKYYCPTWFAQVNAEIRTERIPVHFVVQTPRVVQGIAWIQIATLDEVRQKLSSRELTVNDVRPNGFSVLHSATYRLTWDRSDAALSIVALLIERSAPVDWEYGGLIPTEEALWWSLVFWRRYESRTAAINALRRRLGPHLPEHIDDAYEELTVKLRWTGLHRLICLFSSPALTSIPPELAPQVNIEDSWGWTPLFYAALVRPEVIHALLAAGANPRIGRTILGWVSEAGADSAIGMLVRAGALPNASGFDKRTALHWAAHPDLAYAINGLAVALELVRHAGHLLDWDAREKDGYTPLDWAQTRVLCNPDDADSERLLELYQTRRLSDSAQYIPASPIVDMEEGSAGDDSTGLPPTSLIRAGLRGDVDAIGDLISRGAMVNERDHNGHTLLHLVSLGRVPGGYRVALELVRHGGWGVNWDALVGNGQQEDSDESEDGTEDGTEDDICNNNKQVEDGGQARGTALDIAQARLDGGELTEQEREELKKVRTLLETRRLPPGESYLWPCMDPDFYKPKPTMPGAWDDE